MQKIIHNKEERSMKKITAAVLAIITLMTAMLLAGCKTSAVEVPSGMKIVSSDAEAFYLFVPMTWVTNTSSGAASAYYSDKDRSNVSMTCMVSEDVTTVDDYVKKCQAELAALFDSFTPVGEVTDAVIGERNGKCFEYTAKIGETDYKYRQIVVIYKNLFYVFTYTSTPEGFDLHTDDVDNIVSKIRFK